MADFCSEHLANYALLSDSLLQFVLHYQCNEGGSVSHENFADMVIGGLPETEQRRYLADGGQMAITLRIPKNLKNAAQEQAALKGMSFSAYVRMCLINDLTSE